MVVLPILEFEEKIVETVEENPMVVIIGETGSGKSTQLSQIFHRRGYTRSGMIAVTQPRRVAAVSVASLQPWGNRRSNRGKVGEEEMGGDRKVWVAMDFSKNSKRVLGWAINNLLDHGDTLIVLHVMHPMGDEAKNALWSQHGSRIFPLLLDSLVMGSRGLSPL